MQVLFCLLLAYLLTYLSTNTVCFYCIAWRHIHYPLFFCTCSKVTEPEPVSNPSNGNDSRYSDTKETPNCNTSPINMITIPARAFQNITSRETGVLFSLYSDNALFPIRINQTVSENTTYKAIGSPVIAASLAGHNISNLVETVNISLRIIQSVSFYHMHSHALL